MSHPFRSLLLIILSTIFAGCVSDKEEPVWSLAPGDSLPEFTVEVDGAFVSTESLRGTRSVIIFFNTTCEDCRRALPEIQKAYDRALAHRQDVRYLCISREEDEASVQRYWTENNLTLPYSAQTGRTVYNLFASSIIPRIYISNKDLIIEKVYE